MSRKREQVVAKDETRDVDKSQKGWYSMQRNFKSWEGLNVGPGVT